MKFGSRGALRSRLLLLLSTFAQVTALAVPSTAHATEPDKAVCAESYRSAQTQRKSGNLRRAREALIQCASDRCPSVMQPDCMRWLTEVEAAMPSLTFAATGESGKDVTDVHVSMDGETLTHELDGKAIPVDPGSHTLRFERANAEPIEQPIIVHEGEKARVVSVTWVQKSPVALFREETVKREKSGPPTLTWVFGGVGLAGVATFAVLGLTGLNRRANLEKECFGNCDQSQVDSVKHQFLAADIALGAGALSLGVATVLWLTHRAHKSKEGTSLEALKHFKTPPMTVLVAPKAGGAVAGLTGRF